MALGAKLKSEGVIKKEIPILETRESVPREVWEAEGYESEEDYLGDNMTVSQAALFWAKRSDEDFAYELRMCRGVPSNEKDIFRKNIIKLRSEGLRLMGKEINPIFLEGIIPEQGYFSHQESNQAVKEVKKPIQSQTSLDVLHKFKKGDKYIIPVSVYNSNEEVVNAVYAKIKGDAVMYVRKTADAGDCVILRVIEGLTD